MHYPERTLPVHSATPEKPIHRHPSAHYYAHRVRESLTTRLSKIICGIFLSLLLIFGIIAFIFWLSLSPHRPRFYVEDFSVPALTQSTGLENAQITFTVKIRNSNQHMHIYFDSMVGTVFYRDQSIGSTPLSGPFEQDPKATDLKSGVLSGATLNVNNARWKEFIDDRKKATVGFRLGITSAIQFKMTKWESKIHKLHVDCPVMVGSDGSILGISKDKRCTVFFT